MTVIQKNNLRDIAREFFADRLAGRLITQSDGDIVLVNKQHAAQLPLHIPSLVIRCANQRDVIEALAFVRKFTIRFSVRSGGHCFADNSNLGDAIIDLADLNSIELTAEGMLQLGPGALSGDVIRHLNPYGLTVPTGGCALVGMVGLILAGGFGFLGRKHGLLVDHVESIEMVLADGTPIAADRRQNVDLFWAMRGAGTAGLGIVTAVRIKPVTLEGGFACFGMWPIAEAAQVIDIWQKWAPSAPTSASIELSLVAPEEPEEECYLKLYGVVSGDITDASTILEEFAERLGKHAAGVHANELPPDILAKHAVGLRTYLGEDGWLPSRPYRAVGFQATKSGFFSSTLSAQSIEELIDNLQAERVTNQSREVEFIPWQGAYASTDPSSCFAHRDAYMMLRHTGLSGSKADTSTLRSTSDWSIRSKACTARDGNDGIYSGYADGSLAEFECIYYGSAVSRLKEIKSDRDPTNLFCGMQHIITK